MSAALDLTQFVALIEPNHFDTAQSLSLPWFDNCTFDSDEWILKSDKNAEKSYVLKLANEPIGVGGETLADNPDLLRTVKLFLILSWSMKRGQVVVSNTTPESIYKTYSQVMSFYRYLKQTLGVSNLSSINNAVAQQIQEDYLNKTLEQRLDVENRAITALRELCADEKRLKTFKVFRDNRSGAQPEFDHTRFLAELGLSMRAAQGCHDYQALRIKLLTKHGFSVKKNLSDKTGKGSTKTVQTADTIRKALQPVQGLLKATFILKPLFPVSQHTTQQWLAGMKISTASKKSATAKRSKTRNIPRKVFYRLMDEAIRWVLDYSDDLLAFQAQAVSQYRDYVANCRSQKKHASIEGKQHYASKKMTEWFKSNRPAVFPYRINAIEKATQAKVVAIDPAIVADARALRDQGLALREIGHRMGVSKATAHRWVNYTPPLQGTSLQRAINTHLVSACLLVIFAFTARRKDEVMGLDVGCIEELNGSYFITVNQEKKNQGERPLPTTKLVAMAVALLEKIGADARSALGSSKLLKLSSMVSNVTQDAWPDFNDFCEYCGIEALDDEGHHYSFADHQFRRFLAMTYYYRYDEPDLPTLTWFLGHEDTEMTMAYIQDEDGQWAFKSVKNERIIDLVEEEFKAGTSVVSDELEELFGQIDGQVESRIDRMEKKGKLVDQYVLAFVADGACLGRSEAIKTRSRCLENDAVQVSGATRGSCKGCPNLVPIDQPMSADKVHDLTITQSPMLAAVKQQGVRHV